MKILLIDNYDSFTYNLYHYITKFQKKVDVARNDKIVISPGPGNPNEAGNCLKIIEKIYK